MKRFKQINSYYYYYYYYVYLLYIYLFKLYLQMNKEYIYIGLINSIIVGNQIKYDLVGYEPTVSLLSFRPKTQRTDYDWLYIAITC